MHTLQFTHPDFTLTTLQVPHFCVTILYPVVLGSGSAQVYVPVDKKEVKEMVGCVGRVWK